MDFQINIPTDNDGFYSLECPYCQDKFKLLPADRDNVDVLELFCPYCGLVKEKSSFIPQEIIDHFQTVAANQVRKEMYQAFKKPKSKKKKSALTFEMKKPKEEPPALLTEDEELEQVKMICCNKVIKAKMIQNVSNLYCPYCGVN